jgi:hypothetical protein
VILRGIAARRLLSLTIFALSVLVVSGTVVSVAFSRLTDVSRGSAGALVLLGFVALAAQSVESVRRREHELALARLRGRRGLRLVAFAVAEPCVVVLSGAVGGVVVGWFVTRLVVGAWLPQGTEVSLGRDEWVGVTLVTVGSLFLVVASSWRISRAPLLEQLAGARRPRTSTTLGLFLQLVLVIGAVVSIYQAHQASRSRVDWVTLVSPAVVGLAAGQVVIWLVLALLAVVVQRNRARLGWFITLRRLLRRADSLAVVRMVVAAGVVFGVAASASNAAQSWREDRARLQVGAPVSYPVHAGALRAYAAARAADPQGRWLLPVAAYTASTEGGSRRVFVDSDRWRAVVGGFFDGTPSGALANRFDAFPATPSVRYGTGRAMTATVVSRSLQGTRGLNLSFQYVDDAGDSMVANLRLRADGGASAGPGLTRFSGSVRDCQVACTVVEIDIGGLTQDPRRPGPPLHLVDATFAGQELLGWATGIRLAPGQLGLHVERDGASLVIKTSAFTTSDSWTLGRFKGLMPEPAVSTGGFTFQTSNGMPSVPGVDGSAHGVSVVARVPVLPFVGTRGSLLDLGNVLVGAGGSIPETDAMILARSDTPDAVISALRATSSVGTPTRYTRVLEKLGETPRAQGTRLYVLVAAFAGLIALVSIASTVAQQTRERRQEAAGLRSVGVRARAISGAYRREALTLALATFVGTSLAAWTACRVLLRALPLVSGWAFAPPLDPAPHLPFIGLAALVAGAVVGLVTYVAFRGVGRASPPRILREDVS